MINWFRRKSLKVNLFYNGHCPLDESLERGLHLKFAREEITKKYNQGILCEVGGGGYGFSGTEVRMPMDGLPVKEFYELRQFFVVNLELTKERRREDLIKATLEFISLVPEKVDAYLSSHKDLERELKILK